MKYLGFVGKYVALPLLLLAAGAALSALYMLQAGKSLNDDANWFETAMGVDVAEMVTLGGVDQYVRMRGRDRRNPVMLDLHGGPGFPQTGMTYRSMRPLTEYFTLVEWDQRGTVRSPVPATYDRDRYGPHSYDRLVDDTIELIEHLQARFGVQKVTLVGHSWGTILGLGVVKKRPDLVAAYVGVGQMVAWNINFDESKRLMLEAAIETGDTATADALSAIPDEWPGEDDYDGFIAKVRAIQRHLPTFGMSIHASKSNMMTSSDLFLDLIISPEMSLGDAFDMLDGNASEATQELMMDLHHRDFRAELGTRFDVPIFSFQGENDWHTPTTLVKPWFETLQAPHKEYVPFEHSGHLVAPEEPGKYLHELVTRVRPFSLPTQRAAGEGNSALR